MEYELFTESGLTFKLPKDFLFRIEKSQTFLSINQSAKENEGIKTAEFLFLDIQKDSILIWVVEAKTGTPQPAKEKDFNEFIEDIKDKLYDSLSLFLAICLNRHLNELPINFQQIELKKVDFKLVLLITSPTYKEEWLAPINDSLNEKLYPLIKKMPKLWNFSSNKIMVINPSMAKEYGLVNN
ncbi:MAG: hypothetical protein WAX77_13805 [Methylococcaceae bacterium]